MTITRDIWFTLSKKDKKLKIRETLAQLLAIQDNKHPISDKFEQGRLANVKKDLETFVINAVEWESTKQLQHQKQFK